MPNPLYTIDATCHVCPKKFKARYNVGDRAKVCTLPTHQCRPGKTKSGKRTTCSDGCCRSKYRASATAAHMDNAIDERKVLSTAEFDHVIADLRKLEDPKRIALWFIAVTGCRLRESLLVRADAVRFQDGPISAVKIPTLKRGGRPVRTVDLDNKSEFIKSFRKWVEELKPDDLLFEVAPRTLQSALEVILEKRKPDRESLVHLFRHTRASQLIAAGADWNYVRAQLGWSSLEMGKIYVHVSRDKVASILDKIR